MFVTEKVEEKEGSIIQIVIITFTDNDLEQYKSTLLPLFEQRVVWVYADDIIKRGYLLDRDLPISLLMSFSISIL